jgi:uridine kinase
MHYNIDDLNRNLKEDPKGFIGKCESEYNSLIEQAAAAIASNIERSPIVLLSGPSGSGKTSTAFKLEQKLEERGIITYTVSIDDYFKDVDLRTSPRTPEGELDYESPHCVDMELLNEHFSLLNEGKEIHIPHFIFSRQKRSANIVRKLRLNENEIAIFEGIHALNDEITAPHPEAEKIYISADTGFYNDDTDDCFPGIWLRLMRRVVRDERFRGSSAAYTIEIWDNVLRGEKLYIDPFKDRADISINSALLYEVPVMKQFAVPLFSGLPADHKQWGEISKILDALKYFADIPADFVPADSLLREFIGGSVYFSR